MNTVEDYLELLVGLKNSSMFKIESSDISILQSIGRQVFRGTALTDRQYSLVKEKLLKYKDQFDNNSNFEVELENLRMPLREIDRSKYIKVCDYDNPFPNTPYHLHKSDRKWIKVRFPFSKKLIVELDKIEKVGDYHHTKGSHEHYPPGQGYVHRSLGVECRPDSRGTQVRQRFGHQANFQSASVFDALAGNRKEGRSHF